ncbi:hypothetical protein F4778DRAFT_44751 [Xylariomycetidae sp. FL2044]|nr:hypothetical protein F4778DRAFT_44751 [Xylariomycetidae sp. FL2044]
MLDSPDDMTGQENQPPCAMSPNTPLSLSQPPFSTPNPPAGSALLAPPSTGTSTSRQPLSSLTSSAINTLPSSSAPADCSTSLQDFRMPWGKHRGSLISQIPTDYLAWLQRSSDAYKHSFALQKAVEYHLRSKAVAPPSPRPTASQKDGSSAYKKNPKSSLGVVRYNPTPDIPVASSQSIPIKEEVPLSVKEEFPSSMEEEFPSYIKEDVSPTPTPQAPYVLKFGKYKGQPLDDVPPEYVAWLKAGTDSYVADVELQAAVAAWEKVPRVYKLPFDQYKGRTLAEVPPTYINWLRDSNALEGHDDLRRAVAEHRENNSALQMSQVLMSAGSQSDGTTQKRRKKPWVIPSSTTSDYRRYYYGGSKHGGQMWIGRHDAVRYFGADPDAMERAGLRPHHKGQRFWLHQVMSYARYYGTTRGELPSKALSKFKANKHNGGNANAFNRYQKR